MTENWQRHYRTTDKKLWTGRPDSLSNERFFQTIECIDLTCNPSLKPNSYALVGFASDVGARRNYARPGAQYGPEALRNALGKLALTPNSKKNYLYDAGSIVCEDDDLEAAQLSLGAVIAKLLKAQIKPIVMGGSHELAWGHYQGIVNAKPELDLGIINFDAHLDLRPLLSEGKGSSGTPFLQIAHHCLEHNRDFAYACLGLQPSSNTRSLMQKAEELKVTIVTADALRQQNNTDVTTLVRTFVERHQAIYLTLCLDVFANYIAPGVSAPQPFGILPEHIQPLMEIIIRSGKVISFDIAELAPPLDINDQTAQLAAHFVSWYLSL